MIHKFQISFRVVGVPRPAGSKKYVGKGIIVDQSGPRGELWRNRVKKAASLYMTSIGQAPLTGPVKLKLEFSLPRPKKHFKLNGTGPLKDNAPYYHLQKPDSTKLLRAVEDAMSTIVYRDDTLVADILVTKRWALQAVHADRKHVGVQVHVEPIGEQPEATPVLDKPENLVLF